MLSKMRGSLGSVFIKILFGLLILSFMAWGIGDILNPSTSGQSIAEVGKREITQQELAIAYQRRASYLRQGGLSNEMIMQLGLMDQVVNDLVDQALFEAESNDLGLGVSDETVARQTHNQRAFQDSLGQFDRARFDMALQQIGYSEIYYINALKRQIETSQLVDSISDGGYAPDLLTNALFNWREEMRTADFLIYPFDDNLKVEQPSENDINTHYEVAKETFRTPELRNVTFIDISSTALASTIDIAEEEIAFSYEERANEFSTAERRQLQQMVLPDQETAQKASEMLAAGENFTDVAMELANMDESTMDLGFLTRDTVPDDQLAKIAFDLPLYEASVPTEGLFGWFIVRTIDIEDARTQPLADVRDRLKNDLAIERAIDLLFEMSNDLDDTLASGATLEEAATALGLEAKSVKNIDARGYVKSIEASKDIPTDAKFLQTLFTTEDGDDSLVEELDDGSFFVLRVDAVTPSRIRDIAEVKQDISDILVADRQRIATETLVKKAVEQINAGDGFASVAAALGLNVNRIDDVKRDGETSSLNKLPPAALSKLFDIKIGTTDYASTGTEFILVNAISQKAANAVTNPTGYRAIQSQLARAISDDILAQYNQALKGRHDVNINRAVINDFQARMQ